jgi:integrase
MQPPNAPLTGGSPGPGRGPRRGGSPRRPGPSWPDTWLPARAGHLHSATGAIPLGGPNFRHTFSTWLEDAGIPARVIDELIGHERSRRGELDGGSRIGARYRHTTNTMAARVVEAIDKRLMVVLHVAEEII